MPDDDRALMERLAALEAEVKQDADAQRARKEAAMAKVREERAKAEAEKAELRSRQASLVRRKSAEPEPVSDSDDEGVFERLRRRNASEADHADGIGGAIELAGKANKLKGELAKRPKKGEKSWMKSGVLSLFLGPVGWLYAGSWREAVPASAAWLLFLAIVSKLSIFGFLFIPILAVMMPLSGIAGAVYALSYNRNGGKRQRMFGEDKKKQLPEKTGK